MTLWCTQVELLESSSTAQEQSGAGEESHLCVRTFRLTRISAHDQSVHAIESDVRVTVPLPARAQRSSVEGYLPHKCCQSET